MVCAGHRKGSVRQWAEFHERNPIPEGDPHPLGNRDRTCIEWCSGKQSRMGRSGPNTAGCARIRLTIDDDLTTRKGLERALQK